MPSQQIPYLGFEINSWDMSITLMSEREHELLEACLALLRQTKVKIRTAVPCVGLKVPASWLCQWAHCTTVLRECKKKVLTDNHGNWEKNTQTSDKDKTELKWRIDHILEQKAHSESRSISHTENRQLSLRLGSTEDWQKASGGRMRSIITKGTLNSWRLVLDINHSWTTHNTDTRVMIDNTTAVSCQHKQGSKSHLLNDVAHEIWQWCKRKGIWVSAGHIPGIENDDVDKLSQDMQVDTKWKLDQAQLHDVLDILDTQPTMDLFASRINTQFTTYVFHGPDP